MIEEKRSVSLDQMVTDKNQPSYTTREENSRGSYCHIEWCPFGKNRALVSRRTESESRIFAENVEKCP